jgi:hypothetical protein
MSPISAFTARRARPLLLGAAILSASVLARSLVAPDAHAAIGACRSEPTAILSNGYALDVSATINTDVSDVQQVNYALVLPDGVHVVSWTDTAAVGPKDTYSVNATNSAGHYSVAVTVNTGTPGVSVTASTILLKTAGAKVSNASVSGLSGQKLWMKVSGW